ncbi:PREDICTED: uncharacterized protein C1orf141 homolog [Chrysochloris asiatica]|uniref:Uncharacterized protein C1orf141 homolog n=1 Tax=Chrysochloris asiatica TaxID=185453 RepID=A0A9B0WM08_CHRAS|nr:PREDICTED: uncharacterized protein C1orf141 homolog [Chrysochloris asiatica]
MAEKVLKKLDILDDQEKIVLAHREKINRLQSGRRKSLNTTLTFDFHLEFAQPITKSALKTVSKIRENKSNEIKKQRRSVSFKSEPELKNSDSENSNFVPENAKTQENKSIDQTKNKTIVEFHPVDHLEDDLNKRNKSPSQMNDFSIKKSESTRNYQLSEHVVSKKTLLPLCFEDELKKPNVKIISIDAPKTAVSQMEQNYTNPIIFHDTDYVQMLLLTKNKLLPHHIENENIYPHKRTNFALEKKYGILKPSSDRYITPSSLKRTMPTAWKENIQIPPFELNCRFVKDKPKKKTSKQILENRYRNILYNFSQNFFSITKKFVVFRDKTVTQEINAKTGKFERMFSTTKPMDSHKFSASTAKCSKPLKSILKVHRVNNITPLDDLLSVPRKT